MSRHTLDEIIADINTLSQQDQRQLLKALAEAPSGDAEPATPQGPAFASSAKDMIREAAWLDEHCDEYAGRWVALDGDRLIISGASAKEVHAAAMAKGVGDALIVKVRSRDALPFAGF